MLKSASEDLVGQRSRGLASRLGPALAWAFGGGAVVLTLALLLYVVAASLGEWLAGESPQVLARLATPPMYQELAILFLGSSALLFATREFGLGAR